MGDAIGESLPAAVGIALSPLPIAAVTLLLMSTRGRANGPAFVIGWIAGIAVVGTIALAVASGANASASGQPKDWVFWAKGVLGLLLLLVAARVWRSRESATGEPEMPHWMESIETFTPDRSAAVAVALTALNPKNLLLVLAGAAAIAGTGLSAGQQAGALAIFTAIATIGVATPVVIYFVRGERATQFLEETRDWMARNNAVVIGTVLLIFGWKLIGDAIKGLT